MLKLKINDQESGILFLEGGVPFFIPVEALDKVRPNKTIYMEAPRHLGIPSRECPLGLDSMRANHYNMTRDSYDRIFIWSRGFLCH